MIDRRKLGDLVQYAHDNRSLFMLVVGDVSTRAQLGRVIAEGITADTIDELHGKLIGRKSDMPSQSIRLPDGYKWTHTGHGWKSAPNVSCSGNGWKWHISKVADAQHEGRCDAELAADVWRGVDLLLTEIDRLKGELQRAAQEVSDWDRERMRVWGAASAAHGPLHADSMLEQFEEKFRKDGGS